MLNSLAPLTVGEFDFIVGNPPWIKWDFLSDDYKQKLSILYLKVYKLFSHTGMKAGLGFAHDDISVVFTYVVLDKYLKTNGTLSFVVKQTLFKGAASREFRKFKIEKGTSEIPVKVLEVVDLIEISPFESASETAIISMKKGEETVYPIPYKLWHKKSKVGIKSDDSLDTVKLKVEIEDLIAAPDPDENDLLASWVVYDPTVPIISFGQEESAYPSRHGIVNDLNNVFFIKPNRIIGNNLLSIENNPDMGRRKKVSPFVGEIESDLVFPTIKSDCIEKWGINGYYYMIVPQKKAGENNEEWLKTNYPKTYEYFDFFRHNLDARASKWFKGGGKPFYSLFGIGEYSFAPYKVAWCCMSFQPDFVVISSLHDDYVGTKQVLPDNVIGYISVDSNDEAHFICGILNSKIVGAYLKSRSTKSKWGIPIDRVKKVPIPPYDSQNELHNKIGLLSQDLHELVNTDTEDPAIEIKELELNSLVSELLQVSQIDHVPLEKPKKVKKFMIYPVTIPNRFQDRELLETKYSNLTFNVLDLETTGYSFANGDKITEIWIGKFQDGKLIAEYHSLINPGKKIPKAVELYSGISNKMVKDSPKFEEISDQIINLINDGILVCHNSKFDLAFLYGELADCTQSIPSVIVLDTLYLARGQFSFIKNDLKTIAQELNLDFENMSKAKKDAFITGMILFWMLDQFKDSIDNLKLIHLIGLQGRFINL